MNLTNQQFRLASRPAGLPDRDTWQLTEESVPDPADGQIAVQVLYTSLDPAMRTWLNEGESYVPPVGVGEVMRALGIGRPQAGETVVVSAAAGAVGSLTGQIASLKGCRAVGIAGGPEKCRLVTEEYGFDAAIDYKAGQVAQSLRQHCPDGIDVYFDNVGGEILEAALRNLARRARIVICGAVSQYNETQVRGPANYLMLLVARASMTGMLVFDYQDQYPQAMAELGGWLREGKIVSREHVVHGGVADFPETLLMLFDGVNTGKLVLKI